jgi:hypothetical protein
MASRELSQHRPRSAHDIEEFGRAPKGLVLCSSCRCAFFKKRWVRMTELDVDEHSDLPVSFKMCPACMMVHNNQYEGRVMISNIPDVYAYDLERFIHNYCSREEMREPMHRLISFNKDEGVWEITLTENQLANKLGQKIDRLFNGAQATVRFHGNPSDVAEITVTFK